MATTKRITTGLWFDSQAEEAARFYTGIFRNSKINVVTRFPDAGQEVHHQPAGSVMVVAFELDGHAFTALNGGPQFKFRGDLDAGELRGPEGNRLLLGEAVRRR